MECIIFAQCKRLYVGANEILIAEKSIQYTQQSTLIQDELTLDDDIGIE